MKEQKHIDRIFQEKFKDFEATPDNSVWQRIEDKLHKKEAKRRIIPIWWRFAGVAAGLLLLFTIGKLSLSTYNNDDAKTLQVVDNDTIKKEKTIDTPIKPNKFNTDAIVGEDNYKSTSKEKTVNNKSSINSSSINHYNNKSVVNNSNKDNEVKKPIIAKSNSNAIVTSSNKINNDDTHRNEANNINRKTQNYYSSSTKIVSAQNKEDLKNNTPIDTPALKNNTIVNNTKPETTLKDSKKEKKPTPSIEEAVVIQENVEDINEKEKIKGNKWSVTPNISPIYFNTMGNGSSIHSQFNNNSKSGNLDIGYGVKAGYAVTEKLNIRSGISKVTVGYNTNDVFIYQSVGQLQTNNLALRNIDFKPTKLFTSIISSETLTYSQVPEIINNNLKSTLNQEISFIEVPLEIAYTISDKKLNVDIIGGMSTLFLEDNNVYADLNGEETVLGKANNINDISYSANFGIGLDYEISKTLSLNVEPTFKYQINTFTNTSGDFQPYIIAVNSGLKFKF